MARKHLRPQDILILAKLVEFKGADFKQKDLAEEIGLSQSEVVHALSRLDFVSLYDKKNNRLNRLEVIHFLENAVKYLFPLEMGDFSRGIKTGLSSKFLKNKIRGGEDLDYVWPSGNGKVKGIAVKPVFETVPQLVEENEFLMKLLNIIDIFRGRFSKRVTEVASTELRKLVLGK